MRTLVNSCSESGGALAGQPDAAVADAHGLLHDLGHGLAAVSYLIEGMLADPSLPGEARHRLCLARQELSRLLDLIGGTADRGAEPFAVRELLEELVSIADETSEARVRLRTGEDLSLHADRTAVWRMASNLVGNAARAAGPNGSVEVDARGSGQGEVTIEISDNGPGFGLAPRGAESLGLVVTTRLARQCGARLHIEPGAERGTRAYLVFPPAERNPASDSAQGSAVPPQAACAPEGNDHG